jgi:hypothetical protein
MLLVPNPAPNATAKLTTTGFLKLGDAGTLPVHNFDPRHSLRPSKRDPNRTAQGGIGQKKELERIRAIPAGRNHSSQAGRVL